MGGRRKRHSFRAKYCLHNRFFRSCCKTMAKQARDLWCHSVVQRRDDSAGGRLDRRIGPATWPAPLRAVSPAVVPVPATSPTFCCAGSPPALPLPLPLPLPLVVANLSGVEKNRPHRVQLWEVEARTRSHGVDNHAVHLGVCRVPGYHRHLSPLRDASVCVPLDLYRCVVKPPPMNHARFVLREL